MSLLSISAAARATGVHRVTIQKHIKLGKLSASKDAAGKPVVDVAELMRVYGPLKSDGSTNSSSQVQPKQQETTPRTTPNDTALLALAKQLEAAQEREEWLKGQLAAEQERSRELERRLLPPGDSPQEGQKTPKPTPTGAERIQLVLEKKNLGIALSEEEFQLYQDERARRGFWWRMWH